jgi:tetratricopeptide (TPR) repeat protein
MVGIYDKTVAVCNEVLNIDFQNKEAADLILTALLARGDYYIEKKDFSNAIKALKALLKITPDNTDIWFKLGYCYFSMPGNYWYKEAEEAFKKVILLKGKEEFISESHYYSAQIYYAQKKNEDAKAAIELAVRNNPDNPEYHFLAAKINRTTDALEEAESEIKQAIELDAENEEYKKLLTEIVKDKLKKERGLKGGSEEQEEMPEMIEEDYKTLIKRGLSYVKREGYDKASAAFRSAADSNPEGMEAHNNMGACLLYSGKYNEALVEFMVSDSMNLKDAEIHINLAIAYYFLGDFKNAKEEYFKAIAINGELSKDTLLIKLIDNTIPAKEFLPKIFWKTPK